MNLSSTARFSQKAGEPMKKLLYEQMLADVKQNSELAAFLEKLVVIAKAHPDMTLNQLLNRLGYEAQDQSQCG
jgi:hypothetical protein